MNKIKSIHNLDRLDKEIYQQQLLSQKMAKQIEEDMDYLKDNFFKLASNSFRKERKKETEHFSIFDHFFGNEHVKKAVSGITERVTDHASEAINGLIDRLFKKHK